MLLEIALSLSIRLLNESGFGFYLLSSLAEAWATDEYGNRWMRSFIVLPLSKGFLPVETYLCLYKLNSERLLSSQNP